MFYSHKTDLIILPVDLVVDSYLMHVQHQPGDVAHNEDADNDHQDDGHAVLPHPPPLPPPPDGLIDLGVEESDADEGKDAEDKQSCPVDVISYIELIHPKQ